MRYFICFFIFIIIFLLLLLFIYYLFSRALVVLVVNTGSFNQYYNTVQPRDNTYYHNITRRQYTTRFKHKRPWDSRLKRPNFHCKVINDSGIMLSVEGNLSAIWGKLPCYTPGAIASARHTLEHFVCERTHILSYGFKLSVVCLH